jgi:SP family facilitated glucose transporter-like MFS transporter 3
MYYSNEILAKALPEWGPYISLSIAIVNVLMTFPPLYLIEVRLPLSSQCLPLILLAQRMGRKPLLELSFLGVLLSLLGVGLGLDMGFVALASVAILAFVMAFAVGLGPIPFVMIPEVSPVHVRPSSPPSPLSANASRVAVPRRSRPSPLSGSR